MAVADRLVRDQAVEQAKALFDTHGAKAIDLVSSGLTDPTKPASERRHARLMIVELERLDRLARRGAVATDLVLWKPPLFSLARLRSLFHRKSKGRRTPGRPQL